MRFPMDRVAVVTAVTLGFQSLATVAAPVPLALSRPDGVPGNPRKPVKVYILAGQSNMVGMGDIAGARPPHARVFYSAAPAIIPGVTTITRNERGATTDEVAVERLGLHEMKAGKTSMTAQVEVPVTGTYLVRAGAGASLVFDGQAVTNKLTLQAGKRYPIQLEFSKGDPYAFWLERVDIPGNGDLVTLTRRDGQFPCLVDEAGKWTARNDVTYIDPRLFPTRASTPLSATSNNGKSIGPEVGFGWVMGTFHDEQVLVIKTAMGNRSLQFDFRPPSSGRTDPNNKFESFEYQAMVEGVRDTLAKIDKVVPGYAGQGYEIAGFGWFQGHKDSGSTKEDYEKNLVNLINDLRRELHAPGMKVVVATVGFHGYRLSQGPWYGVWQAQMAVGDAKQHPEFSGNVASVDTRDFWREVEESPTSQDYHYNRNAGTYLLVGEAMGRAMVRLEGGDAEAIPKSDREAKVAADMAAEASRQEPTDGQKAAHLAAIRPLILESALASFLANARIRPALEAAAKGQKPAKYSPFIKDAVDEVVEYYQAAGIHDYDWQPFGPDLKTGEWEYFGFDLPGHPNRVNASVAAGAGADAEDDAKPEAKPKGKALAELKIALPAGMEAWFAPEFDAVKAGWKRGPEPLGESAEGLVVPEWASGRIVKRQPRTVCSNDVVLLRRTFELPPPREGYRYRLRVAGSAHNNMGESFAVYANGRLLAENREGVLAWRRQGSLPRGVPVYPEFRDLFQGGKVTLAVSSFAMANFEPDRFIPPGQALSVWIEEQKLPPLPN